MSDVRELVADEIFNNRRTFLPGRPCDRDELLQNMEQPILIGGIDEEEGALLLSVLPANSERLSLEPLDKGLSGSKVFQARYELGGRRSKPFVVKVGPERKIEREALALNDIVSQTIMGIGPPVYRRAIDKALLVQDLASLSENSALESMRNRVRLGQNGPDLVRRVLSDRLGPWYQPARPLVRMFSLGDLFEPYLRKGPEFGTNFPPPWDDLFAWVEEDTGCRWANVESSVAEALAQVAQLTETVVHGDLHTQNILIDDRGECWPIDFGWTREGSSALVDLAMLECSLKFLALPMRSELRPLLGIERSLARFEDVPTAGRTPYGEEADRVFRTVQAVRSFGEDQLSIPPAIYRCGLLLMTFALATHPGLNTPYVVASLQILASERPDAS